MSDQIAVKASKVKEKERKKRTQSPVSLALNSAALVAVLPSAYTMTHQLSY